LQRSVQVAHGDEASVASKIQPLPQRRHKGATVATALVDLPHEKVLGARVVAHQPGWTRAKTHQRVVAHHQRHVIAVRRHRRLQHELGGVRVRSKEEQVARLQRGERRLLQTLQVLQRRKRHVHARAHQNKYKQQHHQHAHFPGPLSS